MADEEHKLSPRHPLLKRSVTVIHGGEVTQWVPVDVLEQVEKERQELRRTLAMINVAVIFPTQVPFDVHGLLAKHGETLEQARATLGVLNWAKAARGGGETDG